MTEQILQNVKLLIGGYDLSGEHHSVSVSHSAEMLDRTCFGSSGRKRRAGLENTEIRHGGYWHTTGSAEGKYFNEIGTSFDVMTLAVTSSEGQTAYFHKSVLSEYSPGGTVGDLLAFDVAAVAAGRLIRGKLLAAPGNTTSGTTGKGTVCNFGAPSTVQQFFATLHLVKGASCTSTSMGALKAWIVASCSSGLAEASTLVGTTMLTIGRTSAIGATWLSTSIRSSTAITPPTTSKPFYKAYWLTTGGATGVASTASLNFFIAGGFK